jgi:hypothetical protein
MMRNAGILALLVVVGVLSWSAGRYVGDDLVPPRVDTVRVQSDAPPPAEPATPEQRIVYRTRTDTVQQACLSLPDTYDTRRISLVQPLPVSIEGRRVTLTRYDVQDARYVQDVYRVPRERWALGPMVRADLGRRWWGAQAGVRLQYRNTEALLTYSIIGPRINSGNPRSAGIALGIRWTPYTLRW